MQGVGRCLVRGGLLNHGGDALYCTENYKQIFPEMKLRGLVPNLYIYVSVSDLYILTIGQPILLYCVCGPIVGVYKSLTDI